MYMYMNTPYYPDRHIPVRRLKLDRASGTLVAAPREELFLRGPVPMAWLGKAAALPGKTLNVALAVWWRHGMAKGEPFKLTQQALKNLHVERDAASAGLVQLERAGLIRVERRPGQRPTISIVIRTAGSGTK